MTSFENKSLTQDTEVSLTTIGRHLYDGLGEVLTTDLPPSLDYIQQQLARSVFKGMDIDAALDASDDNQIEQEYRSLLDWRRGLVDSGAKPGDSRLRSLEVYQDHPDAEMILKELQSLGSMLEPSLNEEAPFAKYSQNTDKSWQYVPHKKVLEYLDRKDFIDTYSVFKNNKGLSMIIKSEDGSIDFPVSLFSAAAGFDSWRGRSDGGLKSYISKYGNFKGDSLEAIKHYAGLETPVPLVDYVRVFIQPDGQVFADNHRADSHRIAAAYLKGDKSIKANRVQIIRLEENFIERQGV